MNKVSAEWLLNVAAIDTDGWGAGEADGLGVER
jgi:hypothetical protein